jgi:hypothetical protein
MIGFDGKPVELPKKAGHALTQSLGQETGPGLFYCPQLQKRRGHLMSSRPRSPLPVFKAVPDPSMY